MVTGLFKYINIPVFALSFAIGVYFVSFLGENQVRKIYVYPTPETLDSIQYKDSTDTCFSVKHNQVKCPKDASKIHKIPVQ